jgi:hypothetical protein
MEAKQKGEIASFEPDYFGGFVKVTYSSDSFAGSSISAQAVGDPQQAFVPVPSNPGSDTSVSPVSTYAPKITIHLYSSCVDMSALGANAHVQGTLTASNRLIANLDGFADSSGALNACFNGYITNVNPGYVVKFKVYNSSKTLLKTITATIPRILIKTYNMTNATITGIASAGKPFSVLWSHANLDAGDTYLNVNISGTTSTSGTWSVDFGDQKMRGNDYVDFFQTVNSNLQVEDYFWLPALSCGLGLNFCQLSYLPNSSVTLKITHAGVTHTLSGKTDNYGNYYGYLLGSNQDLIFLSAGDAVSGTGATTFKLVNLTAVPNSSTGKITGLAPANSYIDVSFHTIGSSVGYWKWTHVNSAGNYVTDFSSIGIPAGSIHIWVGYLSPATGNQTYTMIFTDI